MLEVSQNLKMLRQHFVESGFDIRFVGGCVRDFLCGVEPKDIDLCSDATPDEQIAIYKQYGISFHETGLQHGTVTVVMDNEVYEITSLRIDTNQDGRHAVVQYTKDWIADLGRRDLTINAMEMTFDGEIVDPFDGKTDLINRHIRFVGEPSDRMREDYLRILRWLRFHGRFAANQPLDAETVEAAVANAKGLQNISRERVWMEMAKIIAGPGGPNLIDSVYDMGLAGPIDLPMGSVERLAKVHGNTKNPVTLMVALAGKEVGGITISWKWSTEERDLAEFLFIKSDERQVMSDYKRLIAFDGHSKDWVVELCKLNGDMESVTDLIEWHVPVFPMKGQDLIDMGFKPGKELGVMLKNAKIEWMRSDYKMTKEELMRAF